MIGRFFRRLVACWLDAKWSHTTCWARSPYERTRLPVVLETRPLRGGALRHVYLQLQPFTHVGHPVVTSLAINGSELLGVPAPWQFFASTARPWLPAMSVWPGAQIRMGVDPCGSDVTVRLVAVVGVTTPRRLRARVQAAWALLREWYR